MNPFLKPERAETRQAGFNIDTRDLLVEQDALRFKALAYRSRIQNYIYSESYLVCSGGRKCSMPEVIGNDWEGISDEYSDNMYIYVNSASDVIAKGFELEMDYDAGFAYSEALNKLNMMPGLGDETHPANSARGRTWIFGGDIRF